MGSHPVFLLASTLNKRDVFVGNVEIVQGAEKFIPPPVGFECPNHSNEFGIGAPHFAFDLHFESSGGISEGKIYLFGYGSAETDKIVRQQVKSGAEIVDGITEDGANRARDFFALQESDSVFLGVGVEKQENCIRITAYVAGDFRLKFVYMT